ncbi:MAG: DUF362 domain-containing protein [Dethiobacteria bacterium]|jgi:uncharacterized protein (DUF362 family)/Pyruvate/2-oxoacid:ferredoxin oxidoreductase delta subunit|nr:DUF362 domain-containing protein [Bacillota bacterium]HOP69410.1 DUF362 domain-containing protein [Bacillota bacterium]HPT34384.1 DUF362 domain-containing protein [Bacillota bacterium]HPZ65345.1 DUF362 domain-containing protein [Bacillota bacterium]HQD06645.1 DUF362 domain-containing protein [Bacillota bacterium]
MKELETVSLAKCPSYREEALRPALLELLEPWGGAGGLISSGQKVLLKPNLLTAAPPEEAVTSHPALISALVQLFQEAGARVFIGDSPGGGSYTRVLQVTGMLEVARKTGAEILSFSEAGGRLVDGRRIPLAKALEEVDLVVNVAKLKTHPLSGLTAAVKNTFGCVVDKHKMRLHLEHPSPGRFGRLLLDICLAVNPGFNIIDAVIGMEGQGPRNGRPRPIGLLLAGKSAVAVDTVAAAIAGFKPVEVTTLEAAKRRKLPGSSLADIRLAGLSLEEARIDQFDRGVIARGRIDRLVTHYPVHWVMNLFRRMRPYPRVDRRACRGCRICAQHCPPQVISIEDGAALIDRGRCIRCYCCQEMCPYGAVRL